MAEVLRFTDTVYTKAIIDNIVFMTTIDVLSLALYYFWVFYKEERLVTFGLHYITDYDLLSLLTILSACSASSN